MSEIKFRVWDRERGKMYYDSYPPVLTKYADVEGLYIDLNGNLYYFISNVGGYIDASMMPIDSNKYKLLRCTGLKDKNNLEIYEGDIVRHMFKRKELYVIDWNDGSASFYMKPLRSNKRGGYSLFRNSEGYLPYEVIGNIYENPELR